MRCSGAQNSGARSVCLVTSSVAFAPVASAVFSFASTRAFDCVCNAHCALSGIEWCCRVESGRLVEASLA